MQEFCCIKSYTTWVYHHKVKVLPHFHFMVLHPGRKLLMPSSEKCMNHTTIKSLVCVPFSQMHPQVKLPIIKSYVLLQIYARLG